MAVHFLSLDLYTKHELTPSSVFGSIPFLRINKNLTLPPKVAVRDCGDGKIDIGVAFGYRGETLCSPWSAPYMSVDTRGDVSCEDIAAFGSELRRELDDTPVRLVLPPAVYDGPEKPFFDGFIRPDDKVVSDTSFHIPLAEAVGETTWNRRSRRNLRKAVEAGLRLVKIDNLDSCYNLIADHHDRHGYRMAMALDAVRVTSLVVPVDFWLVVEGDTPVAAAYCYRVCPKAVQVINSGDTPRGREIGAMTFMARALVDHYRNILVVDEGRADAFLDYGPTSVDGVQNDGLVAFKTGIGCIETEKLTLLTTPRS